MFGLFKKRECGKLTYQQAIDALNFWRGEYKTKYAEKCELQLEVFKLKSQLQYPFPPNSEVAELTESNNQLRIKVMNLEAEIIRMQMPDLINDGGNDYAPF